MFSFYKALFKNPRSVGAISPSAKPLARAMAACVPKSHSGFVVEIGAGTGAVTKAMLERGIPPQKIIIVEHSEFLAELLVHRFPEVNVIHGNAIHLVKLLGAYNERIGTIISSLPLLILHEETKRRIIDQINAVLKKDGYYIQYTYWYTKSAFESLERYTKIHTQRIWLNLPPARVDVFKVID